MSTEYFSLLRSMPVLAGLSDHTLEHLTGDAHEVARSPNDYFFRQGDSGDSLFVITQGSVWVERDWQGKNVELGQLGKGDCFGEMSLIDLMPRSASVRAIGDCRALEIPHQSLQGLFRQSLEQYAIIMMNMGREVSRRLRKADDRLFSIEQQLPELNA